MIYVNISYILNYINIIFQELELRHRKNVLAQKFRHTSDLATCPQSDILEKHQNLIKIKKHLCLNFMEEPQ